MNTIRIQLTDDNQVRVEFHGSGLIPVQEYDPTRLAELQQLFTEAVAWCARTPGEPKDVAATQEPKPAWVEPGSPIRHCPACGATSHLIHPQVAPSGVSPEDARLLKVNDLERRIDELEEFLHDDYGDTVEQLGKPKVAELERELQELKTKRAAMNESRQSRWDGSENPTAHCEACPHSA